MCTGQLEPIPRVSCAKVMIQLLEAELATGEQAAVSQATKICNLQAILTAVGIDLPVCARVLVGMPIADRLQLRSA